MYIYDGKISAWSSCNPLSGLAGSLAEAPASQIQLVRVANTLVAPFRHICRIVARAYDKPENAYSVGTGVLVSPYHVLTCAHNISRTQARGTKSMAAYLPRKGRQKTAGGSGPNGWAVRRGWNWGRDCRASPADYGKIPFATPAPNGFFQLR